MGTSKGFIPPKNNAWRAAKTSVSRILTGGYSTEKTQAAISKFAKAYSESILESSSSGEILAGIAEFTDYINRYGINETVKKYQIESLIDKHGNDLYAAILDVFAPEYNERDEQVIRESFLSTMEELNVDNLDDFGKINIEELIEEFIVQYAIGSFESCFAEKIDAKAKTNAEYNKVINDVRNIIEESIVASIDFKSAVDKGFTVERMNAAIHEAFEVLEILEVV